MTVRITETLSQTDLGKMVHTLHRRYGSRANFRGADVGYRWVNGTQTESICLRIHVDQKRPAETFDPAYAFPSEVDGIALDVIPATYKPASTMRAQTHRTERQPFTMGGQPCARAGANIGTLGLIAIDTTTGRPGLLSSWHVLAGPSARHNDPIMRAEEVNGSHDPRDHIARLTRWVLGRSGDAAFAELLSDQPWLPLQLGCFRTIPSCRSAKLGEVLTKAAGTPMERRARVDGIGLYRLHYEIRPGFFEYRDIEGFKLASLPDDETGTTDISLPGDSGSIWTSDSSNAAIGMHFAHGFSLAGGEKTDSGLACDMTTVLDRLQLRLASFQDLLHQNNATAQRTSQQQAKANLTSEVMDESSSPGWPHPQYWKIKTASDQGKPHCAAPLSQLAQVVSIPHTQACKDRGSRQLPRGLDPNARPCRKTLSQDIWPLHFYPTLLDYDPSFHAVRLNEQISRRIKGGGADGIHAFLAHLVNSSTYFDSIGLRQLHTSDFAAVETYLQACDRIDVILNQS